MSFLEEALGSVKTEMTDTLRQHYRSELIMAYIKQHGFMPSYGSELEGIERVVDYIINGRTKKEDNG